LKQSPNFRLFQGIASHLERNIKLETTDNRKYGFDVIERPKMPESSSSIASRLLLFYQMERLVAFMHVKTINANQTLVQLSSLRAVLKQVVVRECCHKNERGSMYWFEVTITFGKAEPGQLASSTRYNNRESVLGSKLLIRVRAVQDQHMRNDKLLLSDVLQMYPHLKAKVDNGSFTYSDLVRTAEAMYQQFRKLYRNGLVEKATSQKEELADFLNVGKVKRVQKPISKIYEVSQRFFNNDYPILVYRGPFTSSPRRILAIILLDQHSVQFLVYEPGPAKTRSIVKPAAWVKVQLPFFDQLLLEGSRLEIGRRLLLIAKNPLLVDLYTKDLTD
jgi:hypothetical protein